MFESTWHVLVNVAIRGGGGICIVVHIHFMHLYHCAGDLIQRKKPVKCHHPT
jgi:hypothetical protein